MIALRIGWPLKKKRSFPALCLEGPRVLLRPPISGDFESWARVRGQSRDHLIPFEPEWRQDSLSKAFFQHRISHQAREWALGLTCSFLIICKNDGDVIGGININNICRGAAQFASLGYWLGQEHQGQGYMYESGELILAYAFGHLKLHRLNAATLAHNGRSIKFLRRLGFEEEGFAKSYMRIQGTWQDHILFGLPHESYDERLNLMA